MSLSASYLLSAHTEDDLEISLLTRFEGDPEGAAYYFWRMHQVKNQAGHFAGRFLRANDFAEFFSSTHKEHDEVEYRYLLNREGKLTALQWKYGWNIFFEGEWFEFVNRYSNLEPGNTLCPFEVNLPVKQTVIMTLTEAKQWISECMDMATHMHQHHVFTKEAELKAEADYLQQQREAFLKKDGFSDEVKQF